MQLNPEQLAAADRLDEFINAPRRGGPHFFRLTGPAGTGKTRTISAVIARHPKKNFVATATTNKATGVLRNALLEEGLECQSCTIFSLLGLRLEPTGLVKMLAKPENPFNLLDFDAVVIDEGSMVNRFLWDYLHNPSHVGAKFIILDDPAQIPPVGESASQTQTIDQVAALTKIMRHQNTIQRFCNTIRVAALQEFPQLRIGPNLPTGDGVEFVGPARFPRILADCAEDFRSGSKVIAWRNKTVDLYNGIIREKLFGKENNRSPWLPEDRIVFLGPYEGYANPQKACTDDEGVIETVSVAPHPRFDLKCWRLDIRLDSNQSIDAWALHDDETFSYNAKVAELRLAAMAVKTRRAWKDYWDFVDAFAKLRYSYALTGHRAQGSTYPKVFLDWRDILQNQNRSEAYRILYTGSSRSRYKLILS